MKSQPLDEATKQFFIDNILPQVKAFSLFYIKDVSGRKIGQRMILEIEPTPAQQKEFDDEHYYRTRAKIVDRPIHEEICFDKTVCPYCAKEVIYQFIPDRGILSSSNYVLIADWIYHTICWNKQIDEHPPG